MAVYIEILSNVVDEMKNERIPLFPQLFSLSGRVFFDFQAFTITKAASSSTFLHQQGGPFFIGGFGAISNRRLQLLKSCKKAENLYGKGRPGE